MLSWSVEGADAEIVDETANTSEVQIMVNSEGTLTVTMEVTDCSGFGITQSSSCEIEVVSSGALEPCDYEEYPGQGCEDGFVCFEGFDAPCPPLPPSEPPCELNAVGDGKCHETCNSSEECSEGFQCEDVEIFQGDVGVYSGSLCVE